MQLYELGPSGNAEPKIEQPRLTTTEIYTPFGMPEDIYYGFDEKAGPRRVDWVVNNCPDVTLEAACRAFGMSESEYERFIAEQDA